MYRGFVAAGQRLAELVAGHEKALARRQPCCMKCLLLRIWAVMDEPVLGNAPRLLGFKLFLECGDLVRRQRESGLHQCTRASSSSGSAFMPRMKARISATSASLRSANSDSVI